MSLWPDPPPQRLARLVLYLRRQLKKFIDVWIPELTLFEDSIGAAVTHLLGFVARSGIVDRLEQGPQSAAQLAVQLNLNAEALHRVLRALSYRGYFRLGPDGRFHNNRLSRALLSSREERGVDFCRYFASASNLAAWDQLDHVLQTGENGFQAAHGCSVWRWFAEHPEEEATFAGAMHGRTYADAPLVALSFPFERYRSVCDIAGGGGGLLSEVMLRHPHLRGTLFDLPGVIEQGRALLARRGVSGVELRPGDIFHEMPSGHDVYLLKNILHDWADADCLKILANCRRAMGPESRLVIIEFTVEHNRSNNLGCVTDVQMMVVTDNGRERSVEDFRQLLEASGLALLSTHFTASITLLEAGHDGALSGSGGC